MYDTVLFYLTVVGILWFINISRKKGWFKSNENHHEDQPFFNSGGIGPDKF